MLGARRILIPFAAVGVLVISGCSTPPPTCGEHHLASDTPVAVGDGTLLSLQPGTGEVRFDSALLSQTDLALEANAQVRAALDAMPVNLITRGSIISFKRCGNAPAPVHIESAVPNPTYDAYSWDGSQWSWLGRSSDTLSADLPDLPRYIAWVETLPTAPTIGTEPDPQTGSLASEYVGIITELYAPGLTVNANGTVSGPVPGAPAPGAAYVVFPVIGNVNADGLIDVDPVQALLNDVTARKTLVDTLISIAAGSNFAGIAVDFQGLRSDQKDAFSVLIEELANGLHAADRLLVVRLPAPDAAGTSGLDWPRLGKAADVIQFELPGEPWAYQSDNAVADVTKWVTRWVSSAKLQAVISTASSHDAFGGAPLSFAEAAAVFVGSSSTPVSATVGTPITVSLSAAQGLQFDPGFGVYAAGPLDGQTRIHTAATLAAKINALSSLRLRGLVIRDVQGAGAAPGLIQPIRAYRQQTAVTGSSELNVQWTITDSDGSTVLSETRPLAKPDLVWTPDRDGAFTLKAAIGTIGQDLAIATVGKRTDLGETAGENSGAGAPPSGPCVGAAYVADVTVPDNTHFDKGKDFVKTWRVRNSGTCAWSAETELTFVSGAQLGAVGPVKAGALDVGKTIDISVPMKSGDRDGAFTGSWRLRNKDGAFGDTLTVVVKVGKEVAAPPPVAPPVGGSGPTQYGIHAHYYGYLDGEFGAQNIANYTTDLGLGWIKIQFRWGDYDYYCGGADLNVLGTMINRANASGLKVLLSIVTAPPCEHSWTADVHAPPDDPGKLANTVGWLIDNFKGRIHGIEVWNEQNISREWVTNPQKLDAARYTGLLAAVYNTVKAKDAGVLVVSGALAPTGWNDGVNATDDFEYLRQMVAAGATQSMYFVGAHVNALRVPPSAKLGGVYDSLFNPPHHSWYFYDTVIGYQGITGKPACVTEFGVATQEGVGAVAGFEWAADNTQQEQADWVTEGMSLCKQWGCKLMILWNLDYGPATGTVNDNALYSFLDMGWQKRPVYSAVKNWCGTNGCR